MLRKIIDIDENLCDGCGNCIPNCAEGALKVIDGKARMIGDLFCDGLGACIGHCPTGAMRVIEREAEPYDEWRVMEKIVQGGPNLIREHLAHLESHGETAFAATAKDYLRVYGYADPSVNEAEKSGPSSCSASSRVGGCPGSLSRLLTPESAGAKKTFSSSAVQGTSVPEAPVANRSAEDRPSALTHWPVQLHLLNPAAAAYRGADVLIAADCTAYAVGNFHETYLRGKALAVACPKLDVKQDVYVQKLARMIDEAKVSSITLLMMEVPCCGGLARLMQQALSLAEGSVPVTSIVVDLKGEKISENRLV